MINIEYSKDIKITTGDLSGIFQPEQLPLKFQIKRTVSKSIVWETYLSGNMWAVYPESEINDVVIFDAKGNYVSRYYWDVLTHGTVFYKSLWLYCKSLINEGIKPKGLVIGTHDGEFGEWVPLVNNFLSDMVLVEGSDKQFESLKENYKHNSNVELVKDIITPNGGEVEFFEGGKGYTNSVVERVIRSWEKEKIESTKKNSTSINQIIREKLNGKIDWLHLDAEGLDASLIMSLEEELIPSFIIFEDFNLLPEEKEKITNWFHSRNFQLHSEAGICMAKRLR